VSLFHDVDVDEISRYVDNSSHVDVPRTFRAKEIFICQLPANTRAAIWLAGDLPINY